MVSEIDATAVSFRFERPSALPEAEETKSSISPTDRTYNPDGHDHDSLHIMDVRDFPFATQYQRCRLACCGFVTIAMPVMYSDDVLVGGVELPRYEIQQRAPVFQLELRKHQLHEVLWVDAEM